ncbi:MAG: DegT/DnrJ/EryC1/StrS family aminotransferase [Thermodesulfobacteriota bacterium]
MNWRVPLSDLDFGKEEAEAVNMVLQSKWLTMGEKTRKFERLFCEYLNVKYAFAVSSGTAALHIALLALEIGKGSEVIVPSLTCTATVNSILYVDATPVYADVNGVEDFNISCSSILANISQRTKALLPVHYGGYPCDMSKIVKIACEHNLYIIEDAAHATGAKFQEQSVGTIGDIGCFSFYSNKNLSCGEGGMVVTNNEMLAEKIKILRSLGMTVSAWDRQQGRAYTYDVSCLGYNYRIDEIRSALGIEQLKKLERNNQRREELVKCYREGLIDVKDISIPFQNTAEKPAYHIFPILLSKDVSREDLIYNLKEWGIQTSVHYPPVHQFTYYKKRFGQKDEGLLNTNYIGAHEVTLPLYPTMTIEDVEYVCEKVKDNF